MISILSPFYDKQISQPTKMGNPKLSGCFCYLVHHLYQSKVSGTWMNLSHVHKYVSKEYAVFLLVVCWRRSNRSICNIRQINFPLRDTLVCCVEVFALFRLNLWNPLHIPISRGSPSLQSLDAHCLSYRQNEKNFRRFWSYQMAQHADSGLSLSNVFPMNWSYATWKKKFQFTDQEWRSIAWSQYFSIKHYGDLWSTWEDFPIIEIDKGTLVVEKGSYIVNWAYQCIGSISGPGHIWVNRNVPYLLQGRVFATSGSKHDLLKPQYQISINGAVEYPREERLYFIQSSENWSLGVTAIHVECDTWVIWSTQNRGGPSFRFTYYGWWLSTRASSASSSSSTFSNSWLFHRPWSKPCVMRKASWDLGNFDPILD